MSVEGRELGWEDTIQNDSQEFEPIPEGDYNVTIEKFDRSRSRGFGKTSGLQYGSRLLYSTCTGKRNFHPRKLCAAYKPGMEII